MGTPARLLGALAAASLAAVALGAGPAPARARACASFDHPGTTLARAAPADVAAQFGVLRRAARPSDRVALKTLGALTVSRIDRHGIRQAGTATDGARFFLVPAEHVLAVSLAPSRCVPVAQRDGHAALLSSARHTYPRHGLCLVAVPTSGAASGQCGPAPGDLAPLLRTGATLYGLVPTGIASVAVGYFGRAPVSVPVHGDVWSTPSSPDGLQPCGLTWQASDGTTLRTVSQCQLDDDD